VSHGSSLPRDHGRHEIALQMSRDSPRGVLMTGCVAFDIGGHPYYITSGFTDPSEEASDLKG
jgi:hypothetical protein